MIVVLIAVLGYAVYTYWPIVSPLFWAAKPKPASTVAPALPELQITASLEAAVKRAAEAQALELPSSEVRLVDPFLLRVTISGKEEAPVTTSTLPAEKKAPPAEPELQGIWMDSGMNIAFISDQSLQVGGTVLGWRLAAITPDHVVMKKGSATKILYLK
jgi:hypothetical protein